MNEHVPRPELGRLIALIGRRWRARLDQRLRHTGLTQARWHALLELSKAPDGLTQRELAERVGIEPATLVRQIDGLELQGLIERCPVEGDRRAKMVRLTEAARPLIDEMTATVDAMRAELLQGVTDAQVEQTLGVLRAIAERLDEA